MGRRYDDLYSRIWHPLNLWGAYKKAARGLVAQYNCQPRPRAAGQVLGRAFNVGDDVPLTQGELARAIMPALGLEPSFSFPYYTRLYLPFVRALLALPESAFGRLNAYLGRRWGELVASLGLVPALAPAWIAIS